MSLAGAASVLALQLAAGAVVDAAATTELRGGLLQPADDAVVQMPTLTALVLQASPSLRAAVETERWAAAGGYLLQVGGMLDPPALAILHSADLGVEWRAASRLRLRARGSGSMGELDPLQAQLQLVNFGRAAEPEPVPYMVGNAGLGAELDLTRRLSIDATANLGATALEAGGRQELFTGALALGGRYALTRRERVRLEVVGGSAWRTTQSVDHHDAAPSLTARAGLEGGAGPWLSYALSGGMASLVLMSEGRWQQVSFRPVGDARVRSLLELPEGRALSAEASVGVEVTPNPVGGIAESRAVLGLGVEAVVVPDVSAGLSAGGFMPLRVTAGAPLELGGSGQVTARLSWSITDELRLDTATWLTMMAPNAELELNSLTATVGLTGTIPLWHSGSRPRGTDPRAGREVGVRAIGAARAPGQAPVEEELPPPPPPELPPPPPPELLPPPVQPPLDPMPPPPPVKLPKKKAKPKSQVGAEKVGVDAPGVEVGGAEGSGSDEATGGESPAPDEGSVPKGN